MKIRHIRLTEVNSTNSYLKGYPQEPDEELTFVWSDSQTAGRGCGTNTWESEPGKNLTFSLLFHPLAVPPSKQFIISMANALALRDTLLAFVSDIVIKWPNDIYWHDCKLAGTLIETTLKQGRIRDCIIGTGLNVNQERFISDAPNPVSLCQISGHPFDREEVAAKVVEQLTRYLALLDAPESWNILRHNYQKALYRRGELCPYHTPDGNLFHAILESVDDDGTLVLNEEGKERRFGFKEVVFDLRPNTNPIFPSL